MGKWKLWALWIGLGLAAVAVAVAQTTVGSQLTYTWATVTSTNAATGALGNYLILNGQNAPRPGNYNIDWTATGTAFSTCTFNAQGSTDNVTWYAVDGGSPVSCVTSANEFVSLKPVLYLRLNIVAISGGDTTSKLIFHYVGGRS